MNKIVIDNFVQGLYTTQIKGHRGPQLLENYFMYVYLAYHHEEDYYRVSRATNMPQPSSEFKIIWQKGNFTDSLEADKFKNHCLKGLKRFSPGGVRAMNTYKGEPIDLAEKISTFDYVPGKTFVFMLRFPEGFYKMSYSSKAPGKVYEVIKGTKPTGIFAEIVWLTYSDDREEMMRRCNWVNKYYGTPHLVDKEVYGWVQAFTTDKDVSKEAIKEAYNNREIKVAKVAEEIDLSNIEAF